MNKQKITINDSHNKSDLQTRIVPRQVQSKKLKKNRMSSKKVLKAEE